MTIWYMHIARWMTKATNTYSEYAIFSAFHCNNSWYERTSMLRYTYVTSLVCNVL
jgi:hypothetical protein